MQNHPIRFKALADSIMINLLEEIGIKTNIETGPWISGGTARRLWFGEKWTNADIDLFFHDEASFSLASSNLYLYSMAHGSELPHITKNAVTYKFQYKEQELKIQCINKKYHRDILDVWESFDYTVCCFALADNILMASQSALDDCTAKILRLIPNSSRGVDGRRVTKYGIYGFKPTRQILEELCKQHDDKNLTQDWDANDDYT